MMDEDGFVVAGTDDEETARAAVFDWLRADDPLMPEEDHRERVADHRPRVGWYRWNPCNKRSCYDGGGHSGHLGYAQGPGRGTFRGVYLRGSS
jgi:hypothetical protein